MLNEYEKRMQMMYELGVMPVPENCARIGSYATDFPGVRSDPKNPGYFLHGADPDEDQSWRPDPAKAAPFELNCEDRSKMTARKILAACRVLSLSETETNFVMSHKDCVRDTAFQIDDFLWAVRSTALQEPGERPA